MRAFCHIDFHTHHPGRRRCIQLHTLLPGIAAPAHRAVARRGFSTPHLPLIFAARRLIFGYYLSRLYSRRVPQRQLLRAAGGLGGGPPLSPAAITRIAFAISLLRHYPHNSRRNAAYAGHYAAYLLAVFAIARARQHALLLPPFRRRYAWALRRIFAAFLDYSPFILRFHCTLPLPGFALLFTRGAIHLAAAFINAAYYVTTRFAASPLQRARRGRSRIRNSVALPLPPPTYRFAAWPRPPRVARRHRRFSHHSPFGFLDRYRSLRRICALSLAAMPRYLARHLLRPAAAAAISHCCRRRRILAAVRRATPALIRRAAAATIFAALPPYCLFNLRSRASARQLLPAPPFSL